LGLGAASYAFFVARPLTIRELLSSTPFTDEQPRRNAMLVGRQPRRDHIDAIDSERRS
jgi:hypothetical protein